MPDAREFDQLSHKEIEDLPELAQQLLKADAVCHRPGFSAKRGLARAEFAARSGLNDALGIPVTIGRSERGVLLFFAAEIDAPSDALLGFFRAISQQFGQFLELRRCQRDRDDARQDLLQVRKMDTVGRLVGGVVHDFNNLLTIILGYGEIVREECGGNPTNVELIDEVLGAGKRAARLTRQLLGFCRKEEADLLALDLNAHVVEMQKLIGRLIGEQIVLTTDLAPNACYVLADPAHIEQVVMNLAVNARDAMSNGGKLTIATRGLEPGDGDLKRFGRPPLGRYVLLSVRDSGCGMDEATRKRIFEPFFTTKGIGKGVGMGLATVSEIVAQYDGQIEVESQPGRGTTFHVLLPAVAPGLTSWQVDSRPEVVPRGDETILLVEDDDRVRELMLRGLRAQGYRVYAVADPTRALQVCREKADQIDVLIADVMLPEMKGPELALRIAALKPSIRVLYVSGYGEEEVRRSELLAKGAQYLQKPFSTFDLAIKVRDACLSGRA